MKMSEQVKLLSFLYKEHVKCYYSYDKMASPIPCNAAIELVISCPFYHLIFYVASLGL